MVNDINFEIRESPGVHGDYIINIGSYGEHDKAYFEKAIKECNDYLKSLGIEEISLENKTRFPPTPNKGLELGLTLRQALGAVIFAQSAVLDRD